MGWAKKPNQERRLMKNLVNLLWTSMKHSSDETMKAFDDLCHSHSLATTGGTTIIKEQVCRDVVSELDFLCFF